MVDLAVVGQAAESQKDAEGDLVLAVELPHVQALHLALELSERELALSRLQRGLIIIDFVFCFN